MATTTTSLGEIAEQFDLLPDPRCHVNRLHPLSSVIVIAILAILAGANGPTAIARWARVKKDLLGAGCACRTACRARTSSAWCCPC